MYTQNKFSTALPCIVIIVCLLLTACIPGQYWELSPSPGPGQATGLTPQERKTGSLPANATPTATQPWVALPTTLPASAGGTLTPTHTPPPVTGELHLAVREDIKTLNPYLVSNASETFVVSLLYDTLLKTDSIGSLISNLAEGWEMTSDGLSLTFWLGAQSKWHDGQPVTAEDVVFSFDFARQQQFPGLARIAALVDRAEALSPREVKFSLLARQADAVRLLSTVLVIIPRSVWGSVDDPLEYSNLEQPIGSGPFRFVEFVPEERVVLRNAENHHLPRPRVEMLMVEILRNQDQALDALQDGELDALGWNVDASLAREVLDNREQYAGIGLAQAPGVATYTLLLNLRKAPLEDPMFRQALAQAIDTRGIVEQVASGFGDVGAAGLFAPSSPWRKADAAPIAFDLQEAATTLQAAGFVDRDGDGLREHVDGSALQIAIACVELPVPLQVARLVEAHLEAIGISAEVLAIAQDEWVPVLMQAEFDVALHELPLSEPELAYFHFHSSRGLLNNGHVSGLNYGGYANAQFDEIASEALKETDPVRVQLLTDQMQDILAADLPRIALYSPQVLSLFRSDRFTGWVAQPGDGLLHRASITGLTPIQGG